jgi:hypothetical protein
MAGVFINATEARERARQSTVIHAEVTALETQVLNAVANSALTVSVSDGTLMTDSNVYYKAYYGITNNATFKDQVTYIKTYFENLSYGVQVTENPQTGDTLVWTLTW